jgi:hypothetical protein
MPAQDIIQLALDQLVDADGAITQGKKDLQGRLFESPSELSMRDGQNLKSRRSKRSADFLHLEAFDKVTLLVAIEVIELDTAFQTRTDFVGVVLEPFERADFAFVHDLAAPAQAGGPIPAPPPAAEPPPTAFLSCARRL